MGAIVSMFVLYEYFLNDTAAVYAVVIAMGCVWLPKDGEEMPE